MRLRRVLCWFVKDNQQEVGNVPDFIVLWVRKERGAHYDSNNCCLRLVAACLVTVQGTGSRAAEGHCSPWLDTVALMTLHLDVLGCPGRSSTTWMPDSYGFLHTSGQYNWKSRNRTPLTVTGAYSWLLPVSMLFYTIKIVVLSELASGLCIRVGSHFEKFYYFDIYPFFDKINRKANCQLHIMNKNYKEILKAKKDYIIYSEFKNTVEPKICNKNCCLSWVNLNTWGLVFFYFMRNTCPTQMTTYQRMCCTIQRSVSR